MASLLVSAAVLGAAWLPPTELQATTTCKSDRQAIATTDRHARTTVDHSLGAALDSTDDETIDNAIDSTGDETIVPTHDETIDNAIDSTDDEAANKTELPGSGCGTAAQYAQACEQALSKG